MVAIADGYAKSLRQDRFINLHTASGLGHGMGNLINSRIMKTPLVVTVGQQDTRHYVRDPLLYDDIVSIGSPVVRMGAGGHQRRPASGAGASGVSCRQLPSRRARFCFRFR